MLDANTISGVTRHHKVRILLFHQTNGGLSDPVKVQFDCISTLTILIAGEVDVLNNDGLLVIVDLLGSSRRVSLTSVGSKSLLSAHDDRQFKTETETYIIESCATRICESRCKGGTVIGNTLLEDNVVNVSNEVVGTCFVSTNLERTFQIRVVIGVVTANLCTINPHLSDVGGSGDSNMVPTSSAHVVSASDLVTTVVPPVDARTVQVENRRTILTRTTGTCIPQVLQTRQCGGFDPHLDSEVVSAELVNITQRMREITTSVDFQRLSARLVFQNCLGSISGSKFGVTDIFSVLQNTSDSVGEQPFQTSVRTFQ